MSLDTWTARQEKAFRTTAKKGFWDACLFQGRAPLSERTKLDLFTTRQIAFSLDPAKVREAIRRKLALVHAEISEALEAARVGAFETTFEEDGKPVGVGSELADVVIRTLDLREACSLGHFDMTFYGVGSYLPPPPNKKRWERDDAPDLLFELHLTVDESYRLFLRSNTNFAQIVFQAVEIGARLGLDVEKEVDQKLAYNESRPTMHGGKRF